MGNNPEVIKASGDNEDYPISVDVVMQEWQAEVRCLSPGVVDGLTVGSPATLTWTAEGVAGTTTNDIDYTLANGVLTDTSFQFEHKQYGEATARVECYSSDGSTSPLSVA